MNKPSKRFPNAPQAHLLDSLSEHRCFLHATTWGTLRAVDAVQNDVQFLLAALYDSRPLPRKVASRVHEASDRVLWARGDANARLNQDGVRANPDLHASVASTYAREVACVLDNLLHDVSPFQRHRHAAALVLWHNHRVQASYAHVVRQHLNPEQQQVLDAQLSDLATSALALHNSRV